MSTESDNHGSDQPRIWSHSRAAPPNSAFQGALLGGAFIIKQRWSRIKVYKVERMLCCPFAYGCCDIAAVAGSLLQGSQTWRSRRPSVWPVLTHLRFCIFHHYTSWSLYQYHPSQNITGQHAMCYVCGTRLELETLLRPLYVSWRISFGFTSA